MGLPMDMHAPTIEAGPTSQARRTDDSEIATLSLNALTARKETIEAELMVLANVLESVSVARRICYSDTGFTDSELHHSMELTWTQVSQHLMAFLETTSTSLRVRTFP